MKPADKIRFYFSVLLIPAMIIGCENQIETQSSDTINSIFTVPFADIKIEKTLYQINSECDTVLTYKTGSNIVIPKNAFVDKDGNPVKGKVKLTYREFTNAFDVYLGGIPMVYDSAGVSQVFETAGMIEINAYSQEQPVFPNPQNKIQVQLNSFQKGNEYNIYQLDTNTGKWNNIGKDDVEVEDYDKAIASLPQVPPEPKKAGQFSFGIGDNTGDYPELKIYKNVLFEPIDNTRKGFTSTEIKVKDIGNGIYNVTFIFDAYGVHKEESCKCYLAFKEGADYDAAMKVYQNKYKALIEKREKMKKEIEDQWKYYFDVKQKYADLGLLDLFYKKGVENLKGEEKITRAFKINGFGFVNCDYPTAYPQGAELIARYKDTKGNDLIINNIVLIEKGRNAIFRYTTSIKFNPQQENILWGVTKDNKLAYIKSDDFKNVNKTDGEYTFTMNVYSGKLKTYEDICKVLF